MRVFTLLLAFIALGVSAGTAYIALVVNQPEEIDLTPLEDSIASQDTDMMQIVSEFNDIKTRFDDIEASLAKLNAMETSVFDPVSVSVGDVVANMQVQSVSSYSDFIGNEGTRSVNDAYVSFGDAQFSVNGTVEKQFNAISGETEIILRVEQQFLDGIPHVKTDPFVVATVRNTTDVMGALGEQETFTGAVTVKDYEYIVFPSEVRPMVTIVSF